VKVGKAHPHDYLAGPSSVDGGWAQGSARHCPFGWPASVSTTGGHYAKAGEAAHRPPVAPRWRLTVMLGDDFWPTARMMAGSSSRNIEGV